MSGRKKFEVSRGVGMLLGIFGSVVVILTANPSQSAAQLPSMGGLGGLPGGFGTPGSHLLTNPPVSPFLNLVQPGLNPGIAYQTLISPQMRLGNTVARQQQQITNLQTGMLPPRQPALTFPVTPSPQTGHPTAFLNTLDYFPLANVRRR